MIAYMGVVYKYFKNKCNERVEPASVANDYNIKNDSIGGKTLVLARTTAVNLAQLQCYQTKKTSVV